MIEHQKQKSYLDHSTNQPQENVIPVIKTQSSPQQGYKPLKPDSHSSNDNPHNLKVGTMIQYGNPPCYGVIKWMGSLLDTECIMAGVELVSCTCTVALCSYLAKLKRNNKYIHLNILLIRS